MSQGAIRKLRSFVIRGGRLTAAQQYALETLWPRYGIDYCAEPLDVASLFPTVQPLLVEIGFGNGETLIHLAQNHPDRNFIGIEVHPPGVGRLLNEIARFDLTNIRVIRHDAVEVLEYMLPVSSCDQFYLMFPDPWPKKRHQKRRILQPALIDQIVRCLKPGGSFHLATDWQDYSQQMLQLLSETPVLKNRYGEGRFASEPSERPLTRFEARGRRLGHDVWDLVFDKPKSQSLRV